MRLDQKNTLVTGGAGFIGSHLVERLLSTEGCASVTVFDAFDEDFYHGKEENISSLLGERRFHLKRGDVRNQEELSQAMQNIDVVFHLAGQAGIRYCNERPRKAHEVNATGTLNVLEAARKATNVEKVVYASSSSVFGDPIKLPIDENHPTSPNSPYGASKLAAELYCIAYERVYRLDTTCLRYFSVYGPRGRPDQVIHSFAHSIAVEASAPVIFGDGSQTRDFTYVSDIVEATILAAKQSKESRGQVFNIGYGKRTTIKELSEKIIAAFGLEGRMVPEYRPKSAGDFPHTLADNQKARTLLSWEPKVGIDEGLRLFLAWYLPRVAKRAEERKSVRA